MPRYFVRCRECLGVDAIEAPEHPPALLCGSCQGPVEVMGRVHRERLVREELRCPCDDRCTGARGPSCNCKCGGPNHGTGRLVSVLVHVGDVPALSAPRDATIRQARAAEYRALRDAVRTAWDGRFGAAVRAKEGGEYLDGYAFGRYLDGKRARRDVSDACALRTHAGRVKALAELLARWGMPRPPESSISPDPPAQLALL